MGEFTEGRVCAGGCGKTLRISCKSGYCEKCWKKSPACREYMRAYERKRNNSFSVTCRGCSKRIKNSAKTGYCTPCWVKSPERRERQKVLMSAWIRRSLDTPEAKMTYLIRTANSRARRAGLPCGARLQDLLPLPTACPVLGLGIDYSLGARTPNSASLDRIVPSLGYVAGNVRIISWRANHLKSDGTPDELYAVAMDAMRVTKRIV